MKNKIEIRHVTKKFKEYRALDDVSLIFEEGKIHGIVGRNGSGNPCGWQTDRERDRSAAGRWGDY